MNRYVVQRTRRQLSRLFRLSLYLCCLGGVLMLVVAAVLKPASVPALVLLGVGSSLIASATFVFITASREGPAEILIDQGIDRIFDNRQQAFDDGDWESLIGAAKTWYRVVGVANHGYVRTSTAPITERAFRAALGRGVRVEILWLDPTKDIAKLREVEEGNRGTRSDAIRSIRWFHKFKEGLPPELAERISLRYYSALPTNGLTWVDDAMIITHYLPDEQNRTCPGLVIHEDNAFLQTVTTLRLQRLERQLATKYIAAYRALEGKSMGIDAAYMEALDAEEAELPGNKLSEEELREA